MARTESRDDKLAKAALKLLAKTGWRDLTLAGVAKAAKTPLAQLQDLRGGRSALIGLMLNLMGAETAARYKAESETVRERLFDVALVWFEVNAARKPAIRALYEGLKYDPIALLEERAAFTRAAQWLMVLAEADSGSFLSARALAFAAIMARAVPVWLDDDADMTATMAQLDANLTRAERFTGHRDARG